MPDDQVPQAQHHFAAAHDIDPGEGSAVSGTVNSWHSIDCLTR